MPPPISAMNRPRREHPAAMPGHLTHYGLLLLFPLLRGVRHIRVPDSFPHWLRGAWIDLTVIAVLFLVVGLSWLRRSYTLSPQVLRLQRGILLRRTTLISLRLVTTLTVERPLWLRLLGAARVAADTDAGNHRMADVRLTVGTRQAHLFLPDTEGGHTLRAASWRLWLLSVLSSDSLSGILLLVAVFRQGGIWLGDRVRQSMLDNLESAADALTIIPRTVALLTLLLLGGWLIGTVRHLLRHLPFSVCRREDTVTVYTGLVTHRIHCCAIGAINYTDRRQTLVARLLGLHTVYISCTGYGKDKNTLAVLIPPCRRPQMARELKALLPTLAPCPMTLRPCAGALFRYIRLPLFLLGALPATGRLLGRLLPLWREPAMYLAWMALLPCLWLLAVRIIDCRTAGIGYQDGRYLLCYSRHLSLHRVTVPAAKVAAIHIRRSLWQRWRGTCDVRLYSYHEFRHPHLIRHLPYEDTVKLNDLFRKEE